MGSGYDEFGRLVSGVSLLWARGLGIPCLGFPVIMVTAC